MKASSSSRVSTRWVFGLLGAVLFCNVLLLHFMQQGPTQGTQQEVDEARQRAQEAGRLAQSLYRDNEALHARVRLLNRERDSLLSGQPADTSSSAGSSSSSRDTGTVARLIEEVKDRSGEMAKQLQREASIALFDHIQRNQNPPSCLPSSSTRFMVCPMMETCGFGCAFHHATYCFIAALRDNRTVVFEDDAHHWPHVLLTPPMVVAMFISPMMICGVMELIRRARAGRAPGWECYFEPLSSCHYSDIESARTGKDWPQWRPNSPDKITYVPFWSRPERGANFFPWASTDGDQTNDPFFIPKVAKDILGLVPHGELGDLRAWFVGQLEKYMLRPNKLTARALREIHAELARVPGSSEKSTPVKANPDNVGDWWKADWELPEDHHAEVRDLAGEWRHPIAAMHVRRTDHSSEAPFRDVSEYVQRIEKWWDEYRARPENRLVTERLRIYLATDEPKVIEEAGKKYPQFVFLTTSHGGRSSGEGERTGTAHTQSLLSDLFHLAKADFFVGTASSQVSRMAYERQQTHSLDRHNWRAFVSLDSPWYFP